MVSPGPAPREVSPAVGADPSALPEQVRLTFTEEVTPQFAAIPVTASGVHRKQVASRMGVVVAVADKQPVAPWGWLSAFFLLLPPRAATAMLIGRGRRSSRT